MQIYSVILILALILTDIPIALTILNDNMDGNINLILHKPPPKDFLAMLRLVEDKPNSVVIGILKQALEAYIKHNLTLYHSLLTKVNTTLMEISRETTTSLYDVAICIVLVVLIIFTAPFIWYIINKDKLVVIQHEDMLADEKIVVIGILIGFTLATAIFLFVEQAYTPIPQGIDEIAFLDEFNRLYSQTKPIEIIAGDYVNLKIYVGNKWSIPRLYMLKVIVEYNANSSKPVNKTYDIIYLFLGPMENTTVLEAVRIDLPGIHKVIVSLYKYDTRHNEYVYTNASIQVWVKAERIIG